MLLALAQCPHILLEEHSADAGTRGALRALDALRLRSASLEVKEYFLLVTSRPRGRSSKPAGLFFKRSAPKGPQGRSPNAQRAHFIPSGPRWMPMTLPWTRTSPKP